MMCISVHYKILCRHWDWWIKTEEGKNMYMDLTRFQSKRMYDLLRVREEGEIVPAASSEE